MLIIPAIDLKNGKCVRLSQGRMEEETVFSNSPLMVAKKWEELGAKLLHVVDLDGAIAGEPRNGNIVIEIAKSVSIPIEIGGGIRDFKTAEKYFKQGVARAILGTAAFSDENFIKKLTECYPGKVVAGIDAKDGMVAIKGWVEVTQMKATDLAKKLKSYNIASIIYTDISKDGMMIGPNIDAIREFASSIDIPVIASGGISSLEDLRRIKEIAHSGIEGVIIGKALYTGAIDLREALRVVESEK
ncbi:MAG: 1-(5-phosphoribosyl)-5-[(5-phosphoribosylamino)methylideneamino]imidazole-4-carboxamide isomerase [Candidatus Schekmanbacteria bacterium RBG_16_38_11]|uniref:1-(5-phosphoribosyl)-5-[(5-phosphoribosylamino)methylideneamino] imidazole-4-carboxamide isomerase n=1 Tax=Candidatus Schekmanbacteria bacterium RBG_16_38_11 TaxID=1817880 RepID=A0A1F7RUA9_9BACT|nr:MAG: 1-(5-phosphoribosyl)-5-[(5-phosphoribosylamino)methylideneamino]imidazole-4-carboxamide isomerase [Candidatus Schekmanbacteria bacterium RBG_16_38_11]